MEIIVAKAPVVPLDRDRKAISKEETLRDHLVSKMEAPQANSSKGNQCKDLKEAPKVDHQVSKAKTEAPKVDHRDHKAKMEAPKVDHRKMEVPQAPSNNNKVHIAT